MISKSISESSYLHPEVYVDTQWLEEHINDPKIRIAGLSTERIFQVTDILV
jgi:hypothetical protein